MKTELRIFFTALMFLTRLPVSQFADHNPAYLEKASKYFPVVGWIVGSISAIALLLCSAFTSIEIAVLISLIAGILTTGAFHEDGFADCCDGFGGGWTKEKILDIMKDSRLGTFGTIGLVSILSMKFLLLRDIFVSWSPLLSNLVLVSFIIAAHSISRLMPIAAIQFSKYVYREDETKSKPLASNKLRSGELVLAIVSAALPMLCLPFSFLLAIPVMLIGTILMIRYFEKWIGGYTGDCLGAIQQVSEILFYFSCLLLWKYT